MRLAKRDQPQEQSVFTFATAAELEAYIHKYAVRVVTLVNHPTLASLIAVLEEEPPR